MPAPTIPIRHQLNDAMRATANARLGDVIYDLINQHNALLALLEGAGIAGLTAAELTPLTVALPEDRRPWPV